MKTWFLCTWWILLLFCVSDVFISAVESSTSAQRLAGTVGTSLTFPTKVPLSGTILYDGKTVGLVLNKNSDTGTTDKFKDRLHWNNQTGLFTLSDLRMGDSGVYTVHSTKEPKKIESYQLDVYENLTPPEVTSSLPSSSDDKLCSLLCSVRNGSKLNLFWFKDHVRLNHTSVYSLNATLYLPLEIEKSENDTIRCVASNPVSNKTTTVNIKKHCFYSPDEGRQRYVISAVLSVFSVMAVIVVVVCLRRRKCQTGSSRYTEDLSATEGPHDEVQYSVITHKTDTQAHICKSSSAERLTTIYDQIQPHGSEVSFP